jgi:flagella basal body P-ring formation protein FlgA
MVATAPVNASSVIRPATLRAGDDLIAVRRKQAVVMKINGPGFSIRGLGEALDDGRCGDVVRVRNLDSKRIVKATVLADGSVCPIAER